MSSLSALDSIPNDFSKRRLSKDLAVGGSETLQCLFIKYIPFGVLFAACQSKKD